MNMKNRTALTIVLSAMLLVATACGTKDNDAANNRSNTGTQNESTTGSGGANNGSNGGTADVGTAKQWSEKPKMEIDASKSYSATFKTNKGDFTVELYAKDRPETVNNFVFLSKQHFYDGVTFHRIMQTFMIQGGDPTGTGAGGPGYTIPDELDDKYTTYDEGVLAMAKTAAPNSGGSQFFICTGADAAMLNQSPVYTIFGKVTDGMDIVKKIAETPVTLDDSGREQSKPTEKVVINSIDISEK